MRSVVALAMLAALAWTGAWWNDHKRARAERIAVADVDVRRADVSGRPNRLARKLPASGSGTETVAP